MTAVQSGKRPPDWRTIRFRYLADVKKGRLPTQQVSTTVDVQLVPYLSMEYLRDEITEPNTLPLEDGLLLANEGDILLLWDGSNAGEFIRSKAGIVSSTAARVVPKDVDPSYFYWACKGSEWLVRSETVGMGIPHVSGEYLANLLISVPNKPQQRVIADYLEREAARLDALVSAKEQVLSLLAEKRRRLITRAITRGLDPRAPLRESGISWLGKIPTHWEVKRVKYLFRLVTEPAPDDNDLELLSLYTDIGVRPRKDLSARGNKASSTDGYWIVHRGDLVVNKLLAWMGAFGVSDYEGVTSPAYDILRPYTNVYSGYYHYLFRCGICLPEIRSRSYGIMDMRLRLYFDRLGDMAVPVPPPDEQRQIVANIPKEISRLDEIQTATEQTIALLKERRAALIAAAVTGQIKVV